MSEAEQSRDTAKDPRRDAAAGAATDGDRGAVPAAREPERATKDAQVRQGADDAPEGRQPEVRDEDVRDSGASDAEVRDPDVRGVTVGPDAPGGGDVSDVQAVPGA